MEFLEVVPVFNGFCCCCAVHFGCGWLAIHILMECNLNFLALNLNKLKHFGIFYGYEKLIKIFLEYGGDILALNTFLLKYLL